VVLFAVIGWADYLDGFAARLTGQYSRLGALLDPIVDRLLVISGMVVAWNFHLLPRWALVVVIARELLMLALSRYGLSRGLELKINWAGRLGVAPTMGAPFFAMAGLHSLALVLLYCGMALALLATVLYVRDGIRQTRSPEELSSSD
jgi:cardiolipin synthase